jgi:hypothetical protein
MSPMPKISLNIFGKCSITEGIDPKWANFPSILTSCGVKIVPEYESGRNHHIEIEFYRNTKKSKFIKLPPLQNTLVRVEPKVVNPYQYSGEVENMFGNIVFINPFEYKTENHYYWESGYLYDSHFRFKPTKSESRISNSIGFINENKFSLVNGSNYKKRVKALLSVDTDSYSVHIAGKNWDKGILWQVRSQLSQWNYISGSGVGIDLRQLTFPLNLNRQNFFYYGRVSTQLEFLDRFIFTIAIENESSYVSEKLLNAIFSGALPLYCGPSLKEYDIPESLVVRFDPSFQDLNQILDKLTLTERQRILRECRNWADLESTRDRWHVENGFNRLKTLLKEIIEKNL